MSEYHERLRIVPQFRPDEYDRLRTTVMGRLERRLSRWDPEQIELELSVKERDTPSQRVVIECWLAGVPKLVATSTNADLDRGVLEVRDDLRRQVNRFVERREAARHR